MHGLPSSIPAVQDASVIDRAFGPRAAVPRRALLAAALLAGLLSGLLAGPLAQSAYSQPTWTTYHRDPVRSGVDPDATEPIVPVKSWQSPALGAPIWSQPLVLGSRAYVATVGDKIYALDSATGAIVWEKSAGTPVPSGELPCGDVTPTVGIVGTPVIDPSTNAIYAVADTWDASKKEAHHLLKGYSLSGGEEVLSIAVDPPGADPKAILQRTALNLDAGRVVFGFGGNDGDCGEYRGTVVAAPEAGGSPLFWQYQPAPPSKSGGAVWGPSGPAVDSEGHIYASTGNPNPPGGQQAETYDYSDSVVELSPLLVRIGNFKPESWLQDSNNDADLGSAGPELLPGGLLFQAGKNRIGYLIDESKLGEGAPAVYSHQVCEGAGSFGGDAFANSTIYVPCTDGVRALSYDQAARTFSALWRGPSDSNGPPIVSAGLIWSVATGGFKGGGTKLYGLEPSTGVPRYTEILPSGVADHFASPSAAGGRVFVSSGSSVTAYQVAQLTLEPHYYKNNAPIGAGEKVPIIEWGTLTLTAQPAAAPPTTCEDAAGGFVENPEGGKGAAGKGRTSAFASWNCANAACPAGKVKLGGAEYEKEFVVTSEALPWPSVLTEEAGTRRSESPSVRVSTACVAHGSKAAAPGSPGEHEQVALTPPTICVTTATAKQAPRIENGHSQSKPMTLIFDAGSGRLECAGGAFKVRISGQLKLTGYNELEVIGAKNP